VPKLDDADLRSSGSKALDAARRETTTAERSRAFKWLVRLGFVARGITYGVIGALALALALGAGTLGEAPNQQGALALIARTTLGRLALIVICAALLAYALWKLSLGLFGHGPEGAGSLELKERVANMAAGVTYLVFFAVAIKVLTGSAGGASAEPRQTAAGVLGWPGGQLIVGIGGGALLAISLYQLYDAIRGGFAKEEKTESMRPDQRRLFMLVGRIGLTARALVFGVVGYFLTKTAIDFTPRTAVGIDGALSRLHREPYGPWLVALVAVGLLTFAAFSLFEAAYRRL
jgi:Domain of Unknown Function (DUF1206)